MKILHKTLMVNISHTVELGIIKADLVAQVSIDPEDMSEDFDLDFADIINQSYMGIPITDYHNWDKFCKYHKELGIDLNTLLDEEFNKVFTKDKVLKLINGEDIF